QVRRRRTGDQRLVKCRVATGNVRASRCHRRAVAVVEVNHARGIITRLLAALLAATTLTIDRTHVVARFDPHVALGATIDAHGNGETEEAFTPANVQAMLSAGFQPLSYRLPTERCCEPWLWKPRGAWRGAA